IIYNHQKGKTSVLAAYSLGKAQRLIHGLKDGSPIYVHRAIANLNEAFIAAGVDLPETITIGPETKKEELQNGIVIVPPALTEGRWIKNLSHP
ncbi:hypothetical protein, partial [Salmonella enterica]|uniref:hypothetical protein n=1 Tax=Salmonella enterica TaxID=28901 RepID=UPI0020C29F4B